MNLNLALAVSWQNHTGPLATIQLAAYGPGAKATAKRLGMVIDGTKAHITEITPDLAEQAIAKAIKKDAA